MAQQHDYAETRSRLERGIAALDRARKSAALTNLPPGMSPRTLRDQIDYLDDLIAEAAEEVSAARDACILAGRRGLTVCK